MSHPSSYGHAGPELLGGVGPQKKSQEREPNFPRGGPRLLELRNMLNIKEYSEKLRPKGLKKYF